MLNISPEICIFCFAFAWTTVYSECTCPGNQLLSRRLEFPFPLSCSSPCVSTLKPDMTKFTNRRVTISLGQMMVPQKYFPNPQALSRGRRALTSRGRQNQKQCPDPCLPGASSLRDVAEEETHAALITQGCGPFALAPAPSSRM